MSHVLCVYKSMSALTIPSGLKVMQLIYGKIVVTP